MSTNTNPGDKGYHSVVRPRWWWLNPWRYAMRRDRAYCDALDCLLESSLQVAKLAGQVSAMKSFAPASKEHP